MEQIEIYFSEDNELTEYEAINKGYRNDVYIKINMNIFKVNIYDSVRLIQDFETEIENYGYFSIEPNIILVKEVKKEEIVKIIAYLYNEKYFNSIKPISDFDIKNFKLVKTLSGEKPHPA